MQTDNIFIVHPDTIEQANALKAFVKALKMKFEIASSTNDKPYNPAFVAKIKKSQQEIQKGKTTRVAQKDFKQFLGL